MNLNDIKKILTINIKNIPGWSTKRKIVVFISDDWGDQRIRSEKEYQKLCDYGIPVDKNHITRFDTLATHQDLNNLYEVLSSVRDKNGRSAVFTPFMIMANPDFEKVRASGFQNYYYKDFAEILYQMEGGQETFDTWGKGISEKIFMPEYHGRDHLNVPLWLGALNNENETVKFCFNLHYAHIKTPDMKVGPAVAFYFESQKNFQFLEQSLKDGVHLFKEIFRRKPNVFNPPNGMFHSDFYKTLAESGIKTIAAQHFREEPANNGNVEKKRYRFGQISDEGIVHFISNCAFEPVKSDYEGLGEVTRQIEAAFRWNKPALINTHRVNYVGGRSIKNRDKGLTELKKLLKLITDKWPDVEFMSAGEFAEYLNESVMSKE